MRRFLLPIMLLGPLLAGCARETESQPPAPEPRVFAPNAIRPKILFVGDWTTAKREYLNVQLEVVNPAKDEPTTLTNAEVNEDFFPVITAAFFKDDKELSQKEFSSERSC